MNVLIYIVIAFLLGLSIFLIKKIMECEKRLNEVESRARRLEKMLIDAESVSRMLFDAMNAAIDDMKKKRSNP